MDISTEIAAIQAASQGSELRQPLVGALNKLNSGSLPAVTASDAGKILKVGANGWEVGEKSGYMPVPTATKQITENGTHDVTDYASTVVNVQPSGKITITQNGSDIDVANYALADVSVSGGASLIQKTITQNGIYDPADDNADGYSEVTVDIFRFHDTQYQASGSFSYSKEITIPRTGTYKITAQTYSNGFSLKINNVEQSYSLSVSSDYTYLYYAELSLNAGDIISVSCTSSGRSIATFIVTEAT